MSGKQDGLEISVTAVPADQQAVIVHQLYLQLAEYPGIGLAQVIVETLEFAVVDLRPLLVADGPDPQCLGQAVSG
jgi:hypothetical protein